MIWLLFGVLVEGKIAAKPEGCRVSGMLFVQKVPGSLSIAVHNEGHSVDISRLNTSHTVHMLSFGAPLSSELQVRAMRATGLFR